MFFLFLGPEASQQMKLINKKSTKIFQNEGTWIQITGRRERPKSKMKHVLGENDLEQYGSPPDKLLKERRTSLVEAIVWGRGGYRPIKSNQHPAFVIFIVVLADGVKIGQDIFCLLHLNHVWFHFIGLVMFEDPVLIRCPLPAPRIYRQEGLRSEGHTTSGVRIWDPFVKIDMLRTWDHQVISDTDALIGFVA